MKFTLIFIAAGLIAFLPIRAADSAAPTETTAASTLKYHKDKEDFLLVLEPGQKVIESLLAFMEKEKLPGARFTAIGAVKDVEVAYYDLESKAYKAKKFEASGEVLSLSGSLGYFEEKPVVHAHIALAGPDYKVYGGHLREAEVSITLEVFITPTSERIVRQANTDFPSVRTIKLDAK